MWPGATMLEASMEGLLKRGTLATSQWIGAQENREQQVCTAETDHGQVEARDGEGVWDWHVHTVVFKINNQQGPTL